MNLCESPIIFIGKEFEEQKIQSLFFNLTWNSVWSRLEKLNWRDLDTAFAFIHFWGKLWTRDNGDVGRRLTLVKFLLKHFFFKDGLLIVVRNLQEKFELFNVLAFWIWSRPEWASVRFRHCQGRCLHHLVLLCRQNHYLFPTTITITVTERWDLSRMLGPV